MTTPSVFVFVCFPSCLLVLSPAFVLSLEGASTYVFRLL